jgi:hypothetical protein
MPPLIKVLLPGGGFEDFPDADGYTVMPPSSPLPFALVVWKVDREHNTHEVMGMFAQAGWLGFRTSDLGPGVHSTMGFKPADFAAPEL